LIFLKKKKRTLTSKKGKSFTGRGQNQPEQKRVNLN